MKCTSDSSSLSAVLSGVREPVFLLHMLGSLGYSVASAIFVLIICEYVICFTRLNNTEPVYATYEKPKYGCHLTEIVKKLLPC